ncbi:MAG: hypothetical protein AAGD14_16850, partial [Planctomycetota bacterium]
MRIVPLALLVMGFSILLARSTPAQDGILARASNEYRAHPVAAVSTQVPAGARYQVIQMYDIGTDITVAFRVDSFEGRVYQFCRHEGGWVEETIKSRPVLADANKPRFQLVVSDVPPCFWLLMD